jgi:hypothetical protein
VRLIEAILDLRKLADVDELLNKTHAELARSVSLSQRRACVADALHLKRERAILLKRLQISENPL